MKILAISAVLGMFCYCTNNAMEHNEEKPPIEIKDINDVLWFMILAQIGIIQARDAIREKGKNIYATIKDKNGKVTKESLLNFFNNNLLMRKELFKKSIEYLEQYFHLKGKNDEYECTKDNLTEIFWNNEQKEETQKIEGPIKGIQIYFIRIANTEAEINNTFKEYYKTKMQKKAKEGEEKKKEKIIEEIMKECCEGDKNSDPNTNFLAKLKEICENEELKKQIEDDKREAILKAIQRRITLTENITKDDLRDFIKQKIGPLDEKDNDQIKVNDDKLKKGKKQEGGCPCCDCF